MALTTASALMAASVSSFSVPFVKAASTTPKAGQIISYWQSAGYPVAAANPTVFSSGGQIVDNTVAGSLPYPAISTGNLYLTKLTINNGTLSTAVNATIKVVDILWACSGMSGIVTTAQTVVSPPSLTRYTSGVGVEIFLIWFTATGATATTFTVSYQNQSNSTSTSTVSVTASSVATGVFPVPLAAGDTGVLKINSVTLLATTGTAGNFGVVLVNSLTKVPMVQTGQSALGGLCVSDYLQTGLPKIQTGAHLALFSTGTTAAIIGGSVGFANL